MVTAKVVLKTQKSLTRGKERMEEKETQGRGRYRKPQGHTLHLSTAQFSSIGPELSESRVSARYHAGPGDKKEKTWIP